MKKIICILCCIAIANTAWSQDLTVKSGGDITTLPGSLLFAGSNLDVGAGGDVTTKSDVISSGSLIVTGITTGKITYDRYVKSAGTSEIGTDWHLVSAPVTNQNIPEFVANTANKVRKSNNSGNYAVSYFLNTNVVTKRWVYHNPVSSPEKNRQILANFQPGRGYSMNRTDAGEYTFYGDMANDDVTITLGPVVAGANSWNSVGNPYPSFLPVNNKANATDNLLKENVSNLEANFVALYFWNGNERIAVRQEDPGMELAPGQGFLIRSASASNAAFKFTKHLQTHKTDLDGFYRNSSSVPVIVLSMSNGTKKRTTKVEYVDVSTDGLDVGLDAGAYQDGVPTFSLDTRLVKGKGIDSRGDDFDSRKIDFTIQSLSTKALGTNVAIPLSVRAAAKKELTFSVDATNMPEDADVYLEDVVKETYTKITDAPYKITLATKATGVGRFYLHTAAKRASVEDVLLENRLHIYKTTNNTLKITGLIQGNTTVNMYSIT
ncbi:MAG: hypothetical protein ACWIPI_08335, partial [Polaribacter sp.]